MLASNEQICEQKVGLAVAQLLRKEHADKLELASF
jgi:hypothetical protein